MYPGDITLLCSVAPCFISHTTATGRHSVPCMILLLVGGAEIQVVHDGVKSNKTLPPSSMRKCKNKNDGSGKKGNYWSERLGLTPCYGKLHYILNSPDMANWLTL